MRARTSLRGGGELVRPFVFPFLLIVLVGAGASARAATIYAYDNLSPSHYNTNGDRLIRFDSANPNATVTLVGPSGVTGQGFTGLDFAGDGKLYGVTGFGSNSAAFAGSKLYTVNTTTGAATLVGDVFTSTEEAATDLSWNPQSHHMQMITYDGTDNFLYNIDLPNFAMEPLGRITGLPNGAVLVGLSTNSIGENFVHDVTSDRMYRLNGTAATAMPSPIGFDTNYSQGMTINWGEGNAWYLGAQGRGLSSNGIFRVDSQTGAASTTLAIWTTHDGTIGLPEYETGDLAIVPEPASSLALVIVVGAAFISRQRRA